MAEYVQRYDLISYDGSNSAEVLSFFSPVHGDGATWSIESEFDGVLVLRCDFAAVDVPLAGPDPVFVSMSAGDAVTRVTDMSGSASVQGPRPLEQFAAAFASVPTAAEFAALVERVAALESGS